MTNRDINYKHLIRFMIAAQVEHSLKLPRFIPMWFNQGVFLKPQSRHESGAPLKKNPIVEPPHKLT